MLIAINDMSTMNRYMSGVMAKATHHANHVSAVIPCLLGLAWTYGKDIQVSERANSKLGNVVWFKSKKTGLQYHCRHEYGKCIELRHNNAQGRIVATFTNQSSADAMSIVFSNL